MHDCREIESRLIDLVFDELNADEKLRLLSETEGCAECQTARRSMTSTLVVFDRTIESTSPGENFWQGYDERLRRKLSTLDAIEAEKPVPSWKRIFAVSLPVPVPVAAAVVIALLAMSALALRPSGAEATATPPQAAAATVSAAPAPVQIVEVPVVSERVVTRVVYVERKGREKNASRREQTLVAQSRSTTASAPHAEDEQSGFITRANLAGFEPTSQVKIRMIKRSDEVEK